MSTVTYTSLLGLALPTTGDLSGAWGTEVNNYITAYLDSAVAGALTVTGSVDVSLTKSTGSTLGSTSLQYATLLLNTSAAITVTIGSAGIPAANKFYIVANLSATYAVQIKAYGGSATQVTVAASERCVIVFNGTDYVKVSSTVALPAGSTTQVQYNNAGALAGASGFTYDGSFLTVPSLKDTALTSGRVVYAGAAGLLQDNSGLTFDGTTLTAPKLAGAYVPRVVTYADSNSLTIAADTTDVAVQVNSYSATTINAPTSSTVGVPYNGQRLILRMQSANAQTLTWNLIFQWSTDLASTTYASGSNKYDYWGFMYNAAATKWQVVAKVQGF